MEFSSGLYQNSSLETAM
uniref:Uncharacterized protein n=1 Tax=Arundo donax TaxID=35708 RepID=A0A0A9SMW1_ARUDO